MDEITNFFEQAATLFPGKSKLEVFTTMKEGVLYYAKQASKQLKESASKRYGVVTGFYSSVDNSLADEVKKFRDQITCKKGCAHCCKMFVSVSYAEAEYIQYECSVRGIKIDKDYLIKQSELQSNNFALSPYRNCVFLKEDNTCGIYDIRPIACRKHLVVNDPRICDVKAYPDHVISYIPALDVTLMWLGLMYASGKHGSLPQMLLLSHKALTNGSECTK